MKTGWTDFLLLVTLPPGPQSRPGGRGFDGSRDREFRTSDEGTVSPYLAVN